jgi:hypothetical protein
VNQDLALLASPANARRLLLFSRVVSINLSPAIIELAAQDCLDEQVFDSLVCPYDTVKHTVSQFLLDCGLRGGVLTAYHPEINPVALLNVVRLVKSEIMVITGRRHTWSMAAQALNIALQTVSLSWLEQNLDQIDRWTTVIVETDDHQISPHLLRNVSREFPRLIIYDISDLKRLVPWVVYGQLLFPAMPHPLFPRMIKELPAAWERVPLAAFAVFYNIGLFPHLITIPSVVAALEDDYLLQRLTYHSSLFN